MLHCDIAKLDDSYRSSVTAACVQKLAAATKDNPVHTQTGALSDSASMVNKRIRLAVNDVNVLLMTTPKVKTKR
jgi:hypothetical protein